MYLMHYNHNHDKLGRFSKSSNAVSVRPGNREDLERAVAKADKKKPLESARSYNFRKWNERNDAYKSYVNTSSLPKSDKAAIENRIFKEANRTSDILSLDTEEYKHATNVRSQLNIRIRKGKDFYTTLERVSTAMNPRPSDEKTIDTERRYHKAFNEIQKSENITGKLLADVGYEDTKEGRKFVQNELESDYMNFWLYKNSLEDHD